VNDMLGPWLEVWNLWGEWVGCFNCLRNQFTLPGEQTSKPQHAKPRPGASEQFSARERGAGVSTTS